MFLLFSCSDSLWSNNAYKSAERNLFPQSEWNCGANTMSNNDTNPVMCVPKGLVLFLINFCSDNDAWHETFF